MPLLANLLIQEMAVLRMGICPLFHVGTGLLGPRYKNAHCVGGGADECFAHQPAALWEAIGFAINSHATLTQAQTTVGAVELRPQQQWDVCGRLCWEAGSVELCAAASKMFSELECRTLFAGGRLLHSAKPKTPSSRGLKPPHAATLLQGTSRPACSLTRSGMLCRAVGIYDEM